jgi:hypothetical protein
MLFDCDISKVTKDGDLVTKILNFYNEAVNQNIANIGWHIIDRKFSDTKKSIHCSNTEKEQYHRIKFL